MNPLTNMKNVLKLSEQELRSGAKSSWHDMYRDSAWIFIGGLPYALTEGDIVCVFSQYGEIVNINLIREKATGKSKGFCFICYEDQRSTILAVDNLNGIKILERTLRVDHVSEYKPPNESGKTDEETLRLYMEGCAPRPQIPISHTKIEENSTENAVFAICQGAKTKKTKKHKKPTKSLKKKHKKNVKQTPSSESETENS